MQMIVWMVIENCIWSYMVLRIYTNDMERIVAVDDYRHRGHMANQRARSVSRSSTVGGLRQSYDSHPTESRRPAREADLERHCEGEERGSKGSSGTSRDQAAVNRQAADDFRGIGAGGS